MDRGLYIKKDQFKHSFLESLFFRRSKI